MNRPTNESKIAMDHELFEVMPTEGTITYVINRLYVENFSRMTTEHDLYRRFSRFGNCIKVNIVYRRPKICGFITFRTAEETRRILDAAAMGKLKIKIRGRSLNIKPAYYKPKKEVTKCQNCAKSVVHGESENELVDQFQDMHLQQRDIADVTLPCSSRESVNYNMQPRGELQFIQPFGIATEQQISYTAPNGFVPNVVQNGITRPAMMEPVNFSPHPEYSYIPYQPQLMNYVGNMQTPISVLRMEQPATGHQSTQKVNVSVRNGTCYFSRYY